jgi:heme-degrading monooxygenase HmoA
MIERHWKGLAHANRADQYIHHLLNKTFPALESKEGFKGASILNRTTSEGVEFLIITRWDSIKAISYFAGKAVETAVVPDEVKKMMVRFDEYATHYEVQTNI